MRTEHTATTVYTFDELSDTAKETAIQDNLDFMAYDLEWWQWTYEDAARVGVEITSFDVDRGNMITGDFTEYADDAARLILKEHGHDTDTYQLADAFIKGLADEDNEKEFKRAILEEYLAILRHEYEYLTSEDAIRDTLIANAYEFTIDGKIFGGMT